MEQMQVFEYQKNDIRTVENEDGFWWSLKDVCNALGIVKYRDMGRTLDEDERAYLKVDTLGGKQNMSFINESGLYKVIFSSHKPEAKNFKRWVTHEVLPTIHKTGGYGKAPADAEIVTQIAVVVATTICTELVKQLAPIFQQPPAAKFQGEEMLLPNTCKLERAPKDLRERVDTMLRNMVEEQTLNFSAIARFCTMNGFTISSPSVKNYFDRMGMA